MLTFIFDPHQHSPLYQQLYHFIRREIEGGTLLPQEKLPSKRKLSAHLKVSQNTVAAAYDQLAAEGYIEARPRSGYYVCALTDVLPEVFKKGPAIPNPVTPPAPAPGFLYDFVTNTVDASVFPFPTWARISREVLSEKNEKLLRAVDPRGYYPLRQAICDYVRQYRGVKATPDQIIIGAGSEYLLGLLVQLLGRNKLVAMEDPSYNKVYRVLSSNGAAIHLLNLDDDGIQVEALEASGASVVHLTPSHQFPLGIVMPIRRRMALLKWAAAAPGRYIIEDDYDSEFRFEGRPIPALQGLDSSDHVIYMNTFTRSLAPSMRISYMILPPGLLSTYCANYSFYSSTVTRFEQHTLHRFMADGYFERHLSRMRKTYKARRNALLAAIAALPMAQAITVSGASAGLHLLLTFHNGMGEAELVRRAKTVGVRVYGLSEYYILPPDHLPAPTIVLGYASFNTESIQKAVVLLGQAWAAKD